MPQYNFLCRACKKEFSKILTLSEHEKGKIVCPHCKSKDMEPWLVLPKSKSTWKTCVNVFRGCPKLNCYALV